MLSEFKFRGGRGLRDEGGCKEQGKGREKMVGGLSYQFGGRASSVDAEVVMLLPNVTPSVL